MESELSLHLKNFNNRVKVMNQTNARELILSSTDARNLHNDIFDLLTQIAELTRIREQQDAESTITVEMNGGDF